MSTTTRASRRNRPDRSWASDAPRAEARPRLAGSATQHRPWGAKKEGPRGETMGSPAIYSSKPLASTLSGSIRTLTRCSCGLRHGYASLPRYFFASLSICWSAPSSVNSAGPLTATHLNGSFGSTIRRDARGSCSRCLGFARPRAVLNDTLPSSTSTQTIVECGEPSPRRVVTVPTNGFSSRNCFCLSFSAAIPTSGCPDPQRRQPLRSSPMGVLLPVGTRKGVFLLRSDDQQQWQVEGPLLPGWAVYHAIVD